MLIAVFERASVHLAVDTLKCYLLAARKARLVLHD